MSFGNPHLLWTLFAVPLPVLLHLFFRRRKAQVTFSTLQFFHRQKRYLAHRRRLRELLLLLTRTLALLFLALALCKPLFQSMPAGFATRTGAAIVLDDTLSMNRTVGAGATAFDVALQKANEILDTLAEGDAASVVFLSGRTGIAMTRRRQQVRQTLEAALITGASGSFSEALALAVDGLKAGGAPNRELYVLSDFQRNQAPDKPVRVEEEGPVRTFLLPIAGSSDNLSVERLALASRPKTANRRLAIPFTVRNFGATDCETEAALTVAGETVNRIPLKIPAGESVSDRFEYVPAQAGTLSGWIDIADRALPLDNRRYFSINVNETICALLVESDALSRTSPFFFLKRAIDPSGDGTLNGIRTETAFVQELVPRDLEKAHVVLLANPQPIPQASAALLNRYMENGGTVIVFGGPAVDTATLSAFPSDKLRRLMGARDAREFSGLTFKGPLLPLNDLLQLDLLKWRGLNALTPSPSGIVLAESRGIPLMVQESVGAGKVIACAFSPRRDTSNWPELKSFPIAMIHLLNDAANEPQRHDSLECGSLLRLSSPEAKEIALAHSEGMRFTCKPEKGEVVCSETWRPGILTADQATPRSTALNPVAAESDLTTLANRQIPGIVDGKATLLRTDAALESQIRTYRQGSDLTGLFLFLLLLMLLAEAVLGNTYLTKPREVRP